MNLWEATRKACSEQPTLIDALTWVAVWECERAIQQALEHQRTGVSTAAYGSWDTCFRRCFEETFKEWERKASAVWTPQ